MVSSGNMHAGFQKRGTPDGGHLAATYIVLNRAFLMRYGLSGLGQPSAAPLPKANVLFFGSIKMSIPSRRTTIRGRAMERLQSCGEAVQVLFVNLSC